MWANGRTWANEDDPVTDDCDTGRGQERPSLLSLLFLLYALPYDGRVSGTPIAVRPWPAFSTAIDSPPTAQPASSPPIRSRPPATLLLLRTAGAESRTPRPRATELGKQERPMGRRGEW
jgi:hypothetical protein